MWPYRKKSNINNNHDHDDYSPKTRRPPPSSPNFKRRSFKDIETLTHDDEPSFAIADESSFSGAGTGAGDTKRPAGDMKRPAVFHRVHLANRFTRAFAAKPAKPDQKHPSPEKTNLAGDHDHPPENQEPPNSTKLDKLDKINKSQPRVTVPGSKNRVVVYMTSLRAVRPTFEACRTVRSILQGFRVPVDERDLLMDSSYFDEIRKIMAQIGQGGWNDRRVSLPRVFIGGRYIGGADEIVELHEMGELKKFVSGLPAVAAGVCENCGGFRFNLCEECNGSHKCPLEDGGFRVCTVCNENGLIRCLFCSSS